MRTIGVGRFAVFILIGQYLVLKSDALACYHCDNVTSPTTCYTLSNCSTGENCFTEEYRENNQPLFKLGCRSVAECLRPNHQSASALIGRRSTDITGSCRQCCGVDECNRHMCAAFTTQTGSSTECKDDPNFDCVGTSAVFNLCSDVQHAKTVCRKFCGLCPLVDGNWSDWTPWSQCDVTCEQGHITRSRTCTNPIPAFGGRDCNGDSSETNVCDNNNHCPVAGQWSMWSPWGVCSVTCGIGLERRDRSCSQPYPKYGGDYCTGDTRDDRHCFLKACADGGWGAWSSWDTCSTSCGTGLTHRHRRCDNPAPSQFGKSCDGDATDSKLCHLASCDVDGGWSAWSGWSPCSMTCRVELRTRTRTCTSPTPSTHGQQCPGSDTSTALCYNDARCPSVDGYWSSWSHWISYSTISYTRSRDCIGPFFGGKPCSGAKTEYCYYLPSSNC